MFIGPQSGKFGVVHNLENTISRVANWNIDTISHSPETYYASHTLWGADRNPGIIDWSGSFQVFDGAYLFFPGQFLTSLEMFTAPLTGVYGNPGPTYCGQALVDSVTLNWQWGQEQSLIQTVNFSANGCIGSRDRTLVDATTISPSKMCGLQLQWASNQAVPSTWTTIENVQSASLTLSAENPSFINSSTGCCTHRRPGNIDWNLGLEFTDHRIASTERDQTKAFRLYTGTATYWELLYGIFAGVAGVSVDRQTGVIQSQTNNYSMKGLYSTTRGYVGYYNGAALTNYWPPVATTLTPPATPGAPTGSQEAGAYNVDLSWTSVSGAVGYTIWASKDGTDYACIGYSTSNSYKDVGVAIDDWYYRISAVNAQGQSDLGDASAAITVSAI